MPGDLSAMGCVTIHDNKCDNAVIDDDYDIKTHQASPLHFAGEIANFWPNLQQTGLMSENGNFTNAVTGTFSVSSPNPNSPQMVLGKNTGIVAYDVYTGSSGFGFDIGDVHYYLAGDFNKATASTIFAYDANSPLGSISASDALALDTKIDNGKADAAFLTNSNVIDFGLYTNNQGHPCSNGANAYNVSDPDSKCLLLIKMLTSNGLYDK